MSTHIVCPSGLAGEIRGLKGKEGKLLSDRTSARAGATFEKILAGCWVATTDPGIYDLPADGPLDWSKVLVADRFYTLLQIRARTSKRLWPNHACSCRGLRRTMRHGPYVGCDAA